MRVNAIIVAAGEGKRMGKGVPKPYLLLSGRPLLLHTLARFADSHTVRKVIMVVAGEQIPMCQDLIRSDSKLGRIECVFQSGGLKRQDSVGQGLTRLDPDCEVVVVHDGARPFIQPALIDRCVKVASQEGAVVVGVPVRNTVKIVSADRYIQETPRRESLWEIQTPQAFQRKIITEAYQRAEAEGAEATDDAMLAERLGVKVRVLEGKTTNMKITLPEDLLLGEALLSRGLVP